MARLKWRYVAAAVLAVGGLTPPGTGLRAEPPASATAPASIRAVSPQAPVAFEPNHGQFDPQVRFVSRARGYTLFLTDTEAVISTKGSSPIRLALQNARTRPAVGVEPQPGTVNYLIGNDPGKWRTGIVTYERVTYESVYPGIDLVYYGREGLHEYDLVVDPGADPSRIAMRITGADRIDLDSQTGHLQLVTASAAFTMRAPEVYQIVNGQRHTIAARYTLTDQSSVGFALDAYDANAPLVIDPQLIYGTFLGGTGNGIDQVSGLALGHDGAPFIVGTTETTDFPTRAAAQPRMGGLSDVVVTKLSPDGLQRVYATYIGGSSYDGGSDIAVRADGTAYVVGGTFSDDFPVRGSAYQPKRAGSSDVFVLELNPDGSSIAEATYLGGSDADDPVGVELAAFNDPAPGATPGVFGDSIFIYGSTSSPGFPTIDAAQGHRVGERDAFVTVFDRQTLRPFYSTYVGIAGNNQADDLTVNRTTGDLYLFVQRTDDVGPLLAKLSPRVAPGASRNGTLAGTNLNWEIEKLEKQLAELQSREAAVSDQLTQLRAKLKAAKMAKCRKEGKIALIIPDPPASANPFPFSSCGSGEQLGYRVLEQQSEQRPGAIDATATADQLASVVTMLVMPGCFPVPPSATCNERAVLVFYDKNLDVVAHLNFGGQRVGREFIPTAASLDSSGRLHFIGTTSDNSLPVINPIQPGPGGSSEGFILTLDLFTGNMSFLSYLGGSSFDTLVDIAVDGDGNRWVVGNTQSATFPVTRSGVQPDIAGRIDGFIVKIVP